MKKNTVEKVELKIDKIQVRLESLSDIMFDRFIDHSKDKRPAEQKFYLGAQNKVVFPATNIKYFLFGENPPGCAKSMEGKKGKGYIQTGCGHVFVQPSLVPFLDNKEKEILFKEFDGAKFRVDKDSGRTKQGSLSIKQEAKDRPVLCHPWILEFEITIVENILIDSTKLYNWFCKGGLLIAIGTHRPEYGRFTVTKWE